MDRVRCRGFCAGVLAASGPAPASCPRYSPVEFPWGRHPRDGPLSVGDEAMAMPAGSAVCPPAGHPCPTGWRPEDSPRRSLKPQAVCVGRGDWIRTSDPLLPKQMRYQTAPLPDGMVEVSGADGSAGRTGTRLPTLPSFSQARSPAGFFSAIPQEAPSGSLKPAAAALGTAPARCRPERRARRAAGNGYRPRRRTFRSACSTSVREIIPLPRPRGAELNRTDRVLPGPDRSCATRTGQIVC